MRDFLKFSTQVVNGIQVKTGCARFAVRFGLKLVSLLVFLLPASTLDCVMTWNDFSLSLSLSLQQLASEQATRRAFCMCNCCLEDANQ